MRTGEIRQHPPHTVRTRVSADAFAGPWSWMEHRTRRAIAAQPDRARLIRAVPAGDRLDRTCRQLDLSVR